MNTDKNTSFFYTSMDQLFNVFLFLYMFFLSLLYIFLFFSLHFT